LWINPVVVFTFTRQRWYRLQFISTVALLVWVSNILNMVQRF
jgi:hypothetical protein